MRSILAPKGFETNAEDDTMRFHRTGFRTGGSDVKDVTDVLIVSSGLMRLVLAAQLPKSETTTDDCEAIFHTRYDMDS